MLRRTQSLFIVVVVLLSLPWPLIADDPLARSAAAVREPSARREAMARLIAAGPAATPFVEELLDDEDASVRAAAVYVLRAAGVSETVPRVMRALAADESVVVRIEAAEALGAFGDPQSVPTLVRAARDRDRTVRIHAIASLGRIDAASARDAIRSIVAEAVGDAELETAFVAAGRRKMLELADEVRRVAMDSARAPEVRGAALIALGLMRARDAEPVLTTALCDTAPVVRFNALAAIDELRGASAADAVERTLRDPNEENYVRLRAGWTLATIARPAAVAAFRSLAAGGDEFMAMHAVVILASIDAEAARAAAAPLRARTRDTFVATTLESVIRGETLPWGRR